jgi:hypothetical protein
MMRDPDRIDRVLAKIREVWLDSPDIRLMQMMCYLGVIDSDFCYDKEGNFRYVGCFFDIEDTQVETALNREITSINTRKGKVTEE